MTDHTRIVDQVSTQNSFFQTNDISSAHSAYNVAFAISLRRISNHHVGPFAPVGGILQNSGEVLSLLIRYAGQDNLFTNLNLARSYQVQVLAWLALTKDYLGL